MERKSSKEYSVVFLVEGKKFKLGNFVGSATNSVGAPEAKYSRASAFWFFLFATMASAAVRTTASEP